MWEIERKFLVDHLPPALDTLGAVAIRQGYLSVEPEREVRIRDQAGHHTLTVKQGRSLCRQETEVVLATEQFQALWPCTEGRRLEKVRHGCQWQGAEVCIDVYGAELAGLVIAEVEFASPDASEAFVPPPWVGEEITAIGDYFQLQSVLARQRARG